jgi:hypothetical protein
MNKLSGRFIFRLSSKRLSVFCSGQDDVMLQCNSVRYNNELRKGTNRAGRGASVGLGVFMD